MKADLFRHCYDNPPLHIPDAFERMAEKAAQTPGMVFLAKNGELIDQWIAERRERERNQ